MPIRRRYANSSPPVQYQRQVTPASQPAVRPAVPPAAAPIDRATVTPPQPAGGSQGAQGLINGFGSWAGGSNLGELLKASKGVQLSPEERAQVQQAAGVMQRLAGADGLWNRGDLQNNVNQLERSGDLGRAVSSEINRRWGQELSQRGVVGRALVNGHMRRNYDNYQSQGMNQARGMAQQQLNKGMDGAGIKGGAGHQADKTTPEGLKKSGESISRAEMEQMQKTMDMLKEKSAQQGLPEVSFPNGVPAQFLKDVAEGKSPQQALKDAGAVLKLKNGQTIEMSKLPSMGGDKATEAANKAIQQMGDVFKGFFGGKGNDAASEKKGADGSGEGAGKTGGPEDTKSAETNQASTAKDTAAPERVPEEVGQPEGPAEGTQPEASTEGCPSEASTEVDQPEPTPPAAGAE